MRRAALVLVMAVVVATPLRGQSAGRDALRATVSDTVRARFLARTVSDAVFANAEPRSFQIVRVPIPDIVKGREDLRFDIEAEPQFNIIGTRGGALAGRAAVTDLLVTVGVPGDARAGRRIAARAVFRTGDREVEVPIEMRVTPVYKISLVAESQIQDLKIGERFELSATIRNDGNSADTVRITYELPAGWGNGARDTVFALDPHETAIRAIRLTVPKKSGTGSFFVRTHALSRGTTASTLTTISVGSNSNNQAPVGPVLRTTFGGVGVQNGTNESVMQLSVSGPVTSTMRIDGRASTKPSLASASVRGLARVGSYVTTPHLSLWTSDWRANLGSTVASFSEITGLNAGGSGFSFDLNDQKHQLDVTAAKPVAGSASNSGGSIFGVVAGEQMRFGNLSASASRLRASGLAEQDLSAVGLQLVSNPIASAHMIGGVSYRDYNSNTGVGMLAGFTRDTKDMHADLRFVHAPGGSSAFARAQDELVGSFTQAVSDRLSLGATVYKSHDANAAASSIRSEAYSLTQQYRASEKVSLRADLRTAAFDVNGKPFAFGNTEHHVGGGASARFGDMSYSSDVAFENIGRRVDAGDIKSSESGNRMSWHANATLAKPMGAFGFDASYEHGSAGSGFVPEQTLISVRADRVQLPFGPRDLLIDGEVGYNRWSGIRSVSTIRAGVSYSLPFDMEVAVAAERNPLFYSGSASTPWVFAVRVDKSVGLPRVITGRAAGTVFQDYNGNGRQDEGEPGMPNVVVRRGGARATTERDGGYRFWEQSRGKFSVDPASLPYGWIVNEASSGADIALVPTTRVEVTLVPGAAERMRNVDLTVATVMAKDSAGRVFTARRVGANDALFEALPVGVYEIQIDFSSLNEPLKIDGPAPRVVVTRETTAKVTVPVSGRPLRFKAQ